MGKVRVDSLARGSSLSPTKYCQIISNSMGVMTCKGFRLQERQQHNEDSESCLSCTRNAYRSSSSLLPNVIKICLRISKLWSAKRCVYGRKDAMMIAISPEPIGRGITSIYFVRIGVIYHNCETSQLLCGGKE